MLYIKPKDITYTDMCIWIDNNAYKEDCDREKMFEYLYFIAIMLAHKSKYFNNTKDYEDFAVYMATHTFFRLTNPKQYQYKDDGTLKMSPLKSVLNYMKSTLYPRKVDFQQQYYAQTSIITEDIDYVSEYSFADRLNDTVDELTAKDFELCLSNIVETIQAFFNKKLPYKKSSAEWWNIYVSCLLTFLNSITFTNEQLIKIENYKKDMTGKDGYYAKIYEKESEDAVILFHLNSSMKDYVTVLVRQLRRAIAADLSYSYKTYIPSGKGIELMALSTINGEISTEE